MSSSSKQPQRRARSPRLRDYKKVDTEAKQRHARLAGELIWAWNDLQEAFCFLFTSILRHPLNPNVGKEIWDVLTNDRTQRSILAASLKALYEDAKPAKHLLWAITMTDRLSTYRNDIIHSSMDIPLGERPTVTPSVSVPCRRYLRLYQNQIDIWQLMILTRGDLIRLRTYVSETSRQLYGTRPLVPSPRRPRLRTLSLFQRMPKRVLRKGKARSAP